MKKLFILALVSISFCKNINAQIPINEKTYEIKLLDKLKNGKNDSEKAITCFELSSFWTMKGDSSNAINYLQQGEKFIGKNIYLTGQYYYYKSELYLFTDTSKFNESFLKANELFSKMHTTKVYGDLGSLWFMKVEREQLGNDDKKSLDILLNRVIPYAIKAHDTLYIAEYYYDAAVLFYNYNQNNKANEYFSLAIKLMRSYFNQNPKEKSQYYEKLINVYLDAAKFYTDITKYDTAQSLLDSVNIEISPFPNSEKYPDFYFTEGFFYEKIKDYNSALIYFDKGLRKSKQLSNKRMTGMLLFEKLKTLYSLKKYQEALPVINNIFTNNTLLDLDYDKADFFKTVASVYAKLHDYIKAYEYETKYANLKDSSYLKQTETNINEIEGKYRTSEKEKQILTLQSQKKQAQLAAKNNKLYAWLLGAGCFILLLIAAFSFLFYRNNKKLSAQKEINYQQDLKELDRLQQLEITRAMLEGEERERTRVARDLHDGLGGMLAGVKINLSGMENNYQELTHGNELNKVIGQLDNSITELRRIARNMMPETLLKFGLETALKDLCNFYTTLHLQIDFQAMDIANDIPLSNQINIYRIAQELLSNAVKHANATHIILQCSQNESLFLITIEDNGIGFDKSVLATKKGMGLDNLKNRVEFLKGKMDIYSMPNEGTTINIELNSYAS